jgi:hypothetical protein
LARTACNGGMGCRLVSGARLSEGFRLDDHKERAAPLGPPCRFRLPSLAPFYRLVRLCQMAVTMHESACIAHTKGLDVHLLHSLPT